MNASPKIIRAVTVWAYAQIEALAASGSRDWVKIDGEFFEHAINLLPQIAVRHGALIGTGAEHNDAGERVYYCALRFTYRGAGEPEHYMCKLSFEEFGERYADLLLAIANERVNARAR